MQCARYEYLQFLYESIKISILEARGLGVWLILQIDASVSSLLLVDLYLLYYFLLFDWYWFLSGCPFCSLLLFILIILWTNSKPWKSRRSQPVSDGETRKQTPAANFDSSHLKLRFFKTIYHCIAQLGILHACTFLIYCINGSLNLLQSKLSVDQGKLIIFHIAEWTKLVPDYSNLLSPLNTYDLRPSYNTVHKEWDNL